MNVNEGLAMLNKVFPSLVLRCGGADRLVTARRLDAMTEPETDYIPHIIARADNLGLCVREDGEVYVR